MRWSVCWVCALLIGSVSSAVAEEPAPSGWAPRRGEVVPLADHQVSLRIDGSERLRWHHGPQYPRPFFYPLLGPSGEPLTRMGHPGAENHDHHRSVWFAHHDVGGADFWADGRGTTIRQKHWYAYVSGDQEALVATRLGWYDADGQERLEQDLIAALLPLDDDQYALELQIDLRPGAGREEVELGRTNFGLLAVRVAESISVHFGGGKLTSSEGSEGEAAIFGQTAKWVDYSGPVAVGTKSERRVAIEGITYFDHPENPNYPSRWHVREDGWMGASLCQDAGLRVVASTGLRLRYLLWVHRGWADKELADSLHQQFATRPPLVIRKPRSDERHRQYVVERYAGQPPAAP